MNSKGRPRRGRFALPTALLAVSFVLMVVPFAPGRGSYERSNDAAIKAWHEQRESESFAHEANRLEGKPDKPRRADPYPWRHFFAERLEQGGLPARILLGLGGTIFIASLLLFGSSLLEEGAEGTQASEKTERKDGR